MNTKGTQPILIFDWDGVIVDSHSFKWGTAWSKTFEHNTEQKEMALKLLSTKEGRALNRYDLAKSVLVAVEKKDLSGMSTKEIQSDPDVVQITERFSKILHQEYFSYVKLFPRVEEIMDNLREQGYTKKYVISGTEETDLNYVAGRLKMDKHFLSLFGSPRTKSENFQRILEHERATNQSPSFIVIGDGEEDFKLSQYISCPFIGIANRWNEWTSKNKDFTLVDDIYDIKEILTT